MKRHWIEATGAAFLRDGTISFGGKRTIRTWETVWMNLDVGKSGTPPSRTVCSTWREQ